jgi:hypothetical protein
MTTVHSTGAPSFVGGFGHRNRIRTSTLSARVVTSAQLIWEVAMSDPRAKYPDMAVLADKRIVLAEEKRLLDTAERQGGSVEVKNILAARVHLVETDIREIIATGRVPR